MNFKFLSVILTFISMIICMNIYPQTGTISGRVYNSLNNENIPFVTVFLNDTSIATTSDENGIYIISNLKPGLYNVSASLVGFRTATISEIEVTNSKPAIVDFALSESIKELKTIEVSTSVFEKKIESPVSLKNITENEIVRNPGGNKDISKVIQSLPGVAATVTYRNDIIIRGGSPYENKFYIDDIETPNINHFATQGSTGGPVGMINVDYIRDVSFYSSAFPANKANALSSVMDFKLKDGRSDKLGAKLSLGASDLSATLEGPLNENANFIFSYRRSYLKFLFEQLGLPFLPVYNDFLLKYKWKINNKNEIAFIGLGAIDDSKLNIKLQQTGDEEQKFILGYLPELSQWNYTNGFKYTRFRDKSYSIFIYSRNFLNNKQFKYKDNSESEANKILDYKSQEIENKFRNENVFIFNNIRINAGINLEYAKYNNTTFNKITTLDSIQTINFNSELDFFKWGLFAQFSRRINDRLNISLGIRADANNYDKSMRNLLNQISPVFALSYGITDKLNFNMNYGIYHQMPAYTLLGYRDSLNVLVNKVNNIKYIRSQHIVAGFDYITNKNLKISIEGFLKTYSQYPFTVREKISLANLGSDFGVIGNQEVKSESEGRAYGAELFLQQKLFKGYYGILALTLFKSEFKDVNDKYAPSSWDNGVIFTLTAGKTLKRNWDVGLKWRYSSGMPYTPYDFDRTRTIANWNINRTGIFDWSRLNQEKMPAFHSLDIRIDKKYYYKKLTFIWYVDIQNAYNFEISQPSNINVVVDENNQPVIDSFDSTKYKAEYLESTTGTILPSIGLIFEF